MCAVSAAIFALVPAESQACWGHRPMAMGGVFTALADDANVAYWNVAGSPWMEGIEMGVTMKPYGWGEWFPRDIPGNTYTHTFNLAGPIPDIEGLGFGVAMAESSGLSWMIKTSLGYEIMENIAVGVGFNMWYRNDWEELGRDQDWPSRYDYQIQMDALWRIYRDEDIQLSVGFHTERFWDIRTFTRKDEGFLRALNFRPAAAMTFFRDENNAIQEVNLVAGFYDFFDNFGAGAFSMGAEAWLLDKTLALRMGGYNMGSDFGGLRTFGIGYRPVDKVELGYTLMFPFHTSGAPFDQTATHTIGATYNF